MPCSDGGEREYCEAQEKKRVDHLVQMLCWCCEKLQVNDSPEFPIGLRNWWAEHQARDLDARRKAGLEEERHRKILAAAAKLTEEEKLLLGIRGV